MHDVGIPFDVHQRIDRDRARTSDPPDVVTTKIHQHHVLGPFLVVRHKTALQLLVLLRIMPAATRAGDRPDRYDSIFATHEGFR